MAQPQLLHGDGGEDLVNRILPLDGRVNVGKTWHRHKSVSPFNPEACLNIAGVPKRRALFRRMALV